MGHLIQSGLQSKHYHSVNIWMCTLQSSLPTITVKPAHYFEPTSRHCRQWVLFWPLAISLLRIGASSRHRKSYHLYSLPQNTKDMVYRVSLPGIKSKIFNATFLRMIQTLIILALHETSQIQIHVLIWFWVQFNSLCPTDAIWWHRSGLKAPSHYLNHMLVELSPIRISDIYIRAIFKWIFQPSITKISLK